MSRIPLVALLLLASLVATGCGQYGQRYTGEDDAAPTAASDEKPITDQEFDDEAREADGCTELEEFESEGSTHTTDPNEKVEYEHNPPHSGDHYQIAADWGIYDEQQADVSTVHNLEHGHIVISHKGLSDEEERELLEHVRTNPFHLLLQPRKANPKDGVYYTAWTAQIYCEKPSAAALQLMIDEWRDQGPELFTDDPSRSMSEQEES